MTAGSNDAELKLYNNTSDSGDYTSIKAPTGTTVSLSLSNTARFTVGLYAAITGTGATATIFATTNDTR